MIWLDILCWIALGATMGLWAVWFRRQHSRFWELLAVGMVGGLLGGALGRAFGGEQGGALFIGRTSVLAILLSVIGGAIFAYADVRLRRRHPGRGASVLDERQDVHEPSDAHESVPRPLGGVGTPKAKRIETLDTLDRL